MIDFIGLKIPVVLFVFLAAVIVSALLIVIFKTVKYYKKRNLVKKGLHFAETMIKKYERDSKNSIPHQIIGIKDTSTGTAEKADGTSLRESSVAYIRRINASNTKSTLEMDITVYPVTGTEKNMTICHPEQAKDMSVIVSGYRVYVSYDAGSFDNMQIEKVIRR